MYRKLFLSKTISGDPLIENAVNVNRNDDQPNCHGKSETAAQCCVNLV